MKNKCEKAELAKCIEDKAKELWEKDGCKGDRDLDYWLQAEKIVKGQMKKQQFTINIRTKKGGQIYLLIP